MAWLLLDKTKDAASASPIVSDHKVRWIILNNPLRRYFIDKVKKPLMETIIALAEKYPVPTHTNIEHANSHVMLDILGKFLSYENNDTRNHGTERLFRALGIIHINECERYSFHRRSFRNICSIFFKVFGFLFTDESEHDTYYRDRIQFLLEEVILAILDGRWTPRGENRPSMCWLEPRPYGGEHSIVAKIIKHREKILEILNNG